MTVELRSLVSEVAALLDVKKFNDYCPNGLQVEGRPEIRRIVTGVTATQCLIEQAIQLQADVILVHHGYFWRGEAPVLTGMKKRRIKALIDHDISLLAYHLPLDAHPVLGNNAQLGKLLGWDMAEPLSWHNNNPMGSIAELPEPLQPNQLSTLLEQRLHRKPLHIEGGPKTIRRIAWCTGAAQSYIHHALAAGADAFISGEISEQTTHIAREEGIHYFAAGHHATERYGVQALGQWLVERFDLEHHYVEIDNPV